MASAAVAGPSDVAYSECDDVLGLVAKGQFAPSSDVIALPFDDPPRRPAKEISPKSHS
jgi:hypothetical protein